MRPGEIARWAHHGSESATRAHLATARGPCQVATQRVAHRLADHLGAVIAGHQYDLPLGLVESINSKIAVLCFQARGYRDPEYFMLKIYQKRRSA